jgi:hypothetical protein
MLFKLVCPNCQYKLNGSELSSHPLKDGLPHQALKESFCTKCGQEVKIEIKTNKIRIIWGILFMSVSLAMILFRADEFLGEYIGKLIWLALGVIGVVLLYERVLVKVER